jgi:metal-responsive CopG/Arc/MetJ family transcriptional regulator
MNTEKLYKLLRNKTQLITIKLNPDLVDLLNKTINKDDEFKSRNEFFERSVLRYLEEKGIL